MNFQELVFDRPDRDAVLQRGATFVTNFRAASSAEEQLAVLRQWNDEAESLATQQAIAEVRFSQDTADTASNDNKKFIDDLWPDIRGNDIALLREVVGSPHRERLIAELGQQAMDMWALRLTSFSPEVADDKRRESELVTEYEALLAGIRVDWDGEPITISMLRGYFGHLDRDVRRRAHVAWDRALGAEAEALDRIYDELTRLRHEMARKLGYDNYIPLGYAEMERTDYGAEQVATFRQEVLEHIVPLCGRIRARRATELGIESSDYMFWDEKVRDKLGVPCPKGDHDWMIQRARTMFAGLGPDFAQFFNVLLDGGLMDLKSRDRKAGGGFCTSLADHGVPFIFANFNGTEDDVNVFTHECGHAFQCYSSRDQPLHDYLWPTSEACEIHSMSLEHLSYPFMELFFGDDADRFRIGHLEGALLFMPYGCLVDEFQHRIYEQPELSADGRAALWLELEAKWLPWRKYEDAPYFASGRFWQRQGHIFFRPFYYIDYVLAQVCALQFWHQAEQDRDDAMARYRKLCSLGGSHPFTQLTQLAGLKNPFEAGCLAGVVDDVAKAIGLD